MRRLLALLLVAACEGGGTQAPTRPAAGPVPVRILEVATAPIALDVEAWGTLQAERVVELRPEATGQVVEVRFTDGATVRQGDVLVRLRDGEPRASRAEAEASLKLAEADLSRATALRANDRVSAAELDAATARRDLAQVAIDRAAESLRRTTVRAPFDGWLGERRVDEGDVVNPADVLAVLYESDPLRAAVTVPERLAGWVQLGQQATVRADAWPDATFPGTLTYLSPTVDEPTRTLTVHASVANPEGRLRPGMTVRATLQLGSPTPTLLLPAESVTTTAEGPRVWVVQEGVAHLRPIVTGERREADIVVLSGLAVGDQVVVEGIVRLKEGSAVLPITAPAGQTPG